MYILGHAVFAGGLWIPKDWLETMAIVYDEKARRAEGEVSRAYYLAKRDLIMELQEVYRQGEDKSRKPVNVIHKEEKK